MDLKLSHQGLEPQVELGRSFEAMRVWRPRQAEGLGFCLLSILGQTGEKPVREARHQVCPRVTLNSMKLHSQEFRGRRAFPSPLLPPIFQMIFLNVTLLSPTCPPGFVFLLAFIPSQDHLSRGGELPDLLGVSETQVLAQRSRSGTAR